MRTVAAGRDSGEGAGAGATVAAGAVTSAGGWAGAAEGRGTAGVAGAGTEAGTGGATGTVVSVTATGGFHDHIRNVVDDVEIVAIAARHTVNTGTTVEGVVAV